MKHLGFNWMGCHDNLNWGGPLTSVNVIALVKGHPGTFLRMSLLMTAYWGFHWSEAKPIAFVKFTAVCDLNKI
jgi:hypothetical protein